MADSGVVKSLLQLLENLNNGIDSLEAASSLGVDHQAIVGAVKSLQAIGNVISAELRSSKHCGLTAEGTEVVEQGSHEARVFNCIPPEGFPHNDLMKLPFGKIGFSKALLNKWIRLDKTSEGGPKIFRNVKNIEDHVREKLLLVMKGNATELNEKDKTELKKRTLLSEVTVKSYWIVKGSSFSTTLTKHDTDLTAEMIVAGSWKGKKFKPYNFDAWGAAPDSGHLHPLMKVRTEFRQIFLEMGFTEMPTNNFIESSFWNFDSLFQPQQHPARDQHDTFFLSDPEISHEFPHDYLVRVKTVHTEGGFGSQGYKYEWKTEEAQKNILRTHTTAVSARMLYKLAQQEEFSPIKYFSIDRVFRNETLDATHLAEFHQIEGVVADYGLTLGDLMGILHQFFTKLGITKLRFKPAYNPYTEPSMEVFSYHEGLNKWVEVGNSGIFRPEMLLPMGLPEDVSVIAWGLSLERPTMIKYGINNIRELVGHKVNLQMVYDSPICRLES
ncbi:phenylalanine--tRNA ligase alpha subunit [Takifugu flavidus]|uniref:phenylalanine--tRNA ligase n=1 Tax=Takifugu flavidus TaxID=433684 RepID=A0A5C6NED6_9TELE|nr:phenylalanine--tRNA ligase alpha subunit [Takifugu flavidus]TWW64330.1 Phenylalanine--tRNA ligase alpha subunit [Takifugu flavidus]